MERLTERNKDVVIMKNPKLANERLAEFEDFMEKYNVESMEDLELRLEDIEHYAYNCNVEQIDEIIKLKQENQALKDRWQKLKKIIQENINIYNENADGFLMQLGAKGAETFGEIILDKMQELEKE